MSELTALPLWWATAASIGLFLLIGILVWRLPREIVYQEAPDRARWRDLRVWASLLVLAQIAIYLVFL